MKKKQFRPSASAGYARVKKERDDAVARVTELEGELERQRVANAALYEECTNLDRKVKRGYTMLTDCERESAMLRNGSSQNKKRMSTLISDNKRIARVAQSRWWWSACGWTIAILALANGVM